MLLSSMAFAVPALALADITATKTCVDRNGGGVCEDDWIDCTVRVVITGSNEDFNITDTIPGSFYSLWRFVQTPPGGIDCSLRQNTPMTQAQNGRYCFSRVMMSVGSTFDFKYEAQVRNDRCFSNGDQTCGAAIFRNTNLDEFESNVECVTYSCASTGPSLSATKRWTGPNPVVVGTPVSFTIVVSNNGAGADQNVNVMDVVNPTKFAAPTNIVMTPPPTIGGFTGNTLDATWATLAGGGTITISFDTMYANCSATGLDGACNQAEIRSDSITAGCAATGFITSDNPDTAGHQATCRNATAGGSAQIVSPPVKSMTNLDGPTLEVGDRLQVTVTFQNNAPCQATNGYFEDTLAANLTYVAPTTVTPPSGTPSFDVPTNRVIVNGFTVPGSSNTTISFVAQVNAVTGGTICNTAQYRFGVSNLIDTTQACVGRIDNLSISKRHSDPNGNGTVLRGQIFDYVIDVINSGTALVPDGLFTDTIPSCFDVLAITNAGGGSGSIAGQTVTISAIPLPPGATPTTITLQVQENGTCPLGDSPCNTGNIQSSGTPGPIASSPSCITIEASDLTATKAHSNPNGNGRIQPGQVFEYTISVRNNSAAPLADISISDLIPGCFDVLSVVNAGGGSPSIVGQQVTVTAIPVNAAATTDVVIQVQENGTCALGSTPCNNADVDSASLSAPLRTNDACVELADGCATLPAKITPLFAVKRTALSAIEFTWPQDGSAIDGYRVYSVTDKIDIPRANGLNVPPATLQCSSGALTATTCNDADALSVPDARLYYQVLGVCAGIEGAH